MLPHEIESALATLAGWELKNNKLCCEFKFSDFKMAFAFMALVAFEAEKLNHHPDWKNVYNRVYIELNTHDKGGITKLDIELASTITKISKHGF
jgi:4a-hydroxytetrahydrobiopterin dehydratase